MEEPLACGSHPHVEGAFACVSRSEKIHFSGLSDMLITPTHECPFHM